MKNQVYKSIALLTSISIMFASCSSKRHITISGAPGTEIYNPADYSRLGVIEENGKATIELNVKNSINPYLLAKTSKSPLYVPFAVDYKYKSNAGTNAAVVVGTCVGLAGFVVGTALLAAGDKSGDDGLLTVGGGMYGGGSALLLGMALPASLAMSNKDVKHSFRYLDSSTDNDLTFLTIPSRHEGTPKYLGKASAQKAKKESTVKESSRPSKPIEKVSNPAEKFMHTVAEGETLVTIAQQYGVTVASIIKANKLTGNAVNVGQQLEIPL